MVIDTSVVIAILSNKPDVPDLAKAIVSDPKRFMSAASLLETAIVIESRYSVAGGKKLDEFVGTVQIVVEPVTVEQVGIARIAFRTYGKGKHPASLNFGDCFSYAPAQLFSEPLLFKGNDFSQTDILIVQL